MNFHHRLLLGVIWTLALLCPSLSNAGALLLDMGDETKQTFNGIIVESVTSDSSRGLIFMISPGPGQAAFEVEASRVSNLAFGDNGGDAFYDVVMIGQNGQSLSFPSSNIISYSNGKFMAIAPGRTVQQPLPANKVISMVPGMAPVATPPPLAPPSSSSNNQFQNPIPPQSSSSQAESMDAFDESDFVSDDSSLSDDEYYFDETDFASDDLFYGEEISGGDVAMALVALLAFIYLVISLIITTIWCLIGAAKDGEWFTVLKILLGRKFFYALGGYNGGGKIILQLMVIVELVIIVALLIYANV